VTRGFGYSINYDRAIADDDAVLAWIELSIQHGFYRRPIGDAGRVVNQLHELVIYFPDVASSLGFTPQDVADFAYAADMESAWKMNPDLPEARADRAGYRRGEEVAKQVEAMTGCQFLYEDETQAKEARKKTKASRARHARNKEKYGHTRRPR